MLDAFIEPVSRVINLLSQRVFAVCIHAEPRQVHSKKIKKNILWQIHGHKTIPDEMCIYTKESISRYLQLIEEGDEKY